MRIDTEVTGQIAGGLVVFVGIARGDSVDDLAYVVEKTANLRIFPDDEGRLNVSAREAKAELLVISQFTLYADTRRGRRPSFMEAAPPEEARVLFEGFVQRARALGLTVAEGRFQEHMVVALENDGPVTILLDSADRLRPRSG